MTNNFIVPKLQDFRTKSYKKDDERLIIELCQKYFQNCNRRDKPPTKQGLYNYLGIDKNIMHKLKSNPKTKKLWIVISKCFDYIKQIWLESLWENPRTRVWYLRTAFHMNDASEEQVNKPTHTIRLVNQSGLELDFDGKTQ